MNRTLTRLFGSVIACISVFTQRAQAITNPVVPSYCSAGATGGAYGVSYQKYDCLLNLTGFVSQSPSLIQQFSECTGRTLTGFSSCTGGYCNHTGIYCEKRDFFMAKGCSDGSGGAPCYFGTGQIYTTQPEDGYYFINCLSGFYQNGGSSGNTLVPFASTPSGLRSNCDPCSGMREVSGRFETFSNYNGTATDPNFVWYSPGLGSGATGIASCRGVAKNTGIVYYAKEGNFVLSAEGCPYIE